MWWMGLIQAGMGIAQTAISASQASKAGARPQYTQTADSKAATGMAKRAAEQGIGPAGRAQYEQTLARQATAARQTFRNTGLAGAGAAAANIMGVEAMNNFAVQNEAAKRQGLGMYMSAAQGGQRTADMNIQAAIQERQQLQQQSGQGMQSGFGNMFGGINSMGNAFGMQKATDMYAGMGVGGNGGWPGAAAPGVGGNGGMIQPQVNNSVPWMNGGNPQVDPNAFGGFPMAMNPFATYPGYSTYPGED